MGPTGRSLDLDQLATRALAVGGRSGFRILNLTLATASPASGSGTDEVVVRHAVRSQGD